MSDIKLFLISSGQVDELAGTTDTIEKSVQTQPNREAFSLKQRHILVQIADIENVGVEQCALAFVSLQACDATRKAQKTVHGVAPTTNENLRSRGNSDGMPKYIGSPSPQNSAANRSAISAGRPLSSPDAWARVMISNRAARLAQGIRASRFRQVLASPSFSTGVKK